MILVTGGSGVLGRALAAELEQGAEPFRVVSSGEGDLRDAAATLALFQQTAPRVVVHLAGRVHGLMGNKRFPAEMFTDNVRINVNVIDAAHRTGCEKVVAVSTVATYSSHAPMPVSEDSIWDGPPHASEAAYGHAKRAMLAQLEAYATQYGMAFAYPILTNVYGPHDRFDRVNGHVVPSLVAKFYDAAKSGSAVEIWGTGVAERDFIYSRDAARAILLIAEKHVGPVNVATGTVVKIRDMVEMLARHAKVERVAWDASKPDGQLLRRYDVSRLAGLGFRPEVDLDTGLGLTFAWYAANYPRVRSS